MAGSEEPYRLMLSEIGSDGRDEDPSVVPLFCPAAAARALLAAIDMVSSDQGQLYPEQMSDAVSAAESLIEQGGEINVTYALGDMRVSLVSGAALN